MLNSKQTVLEDLIVVNIDVRYQLRELFHTRGSIIATMVRYDLYRVRKY